MNRRAYLVKPVAAIVMVCAVVLCLQPISEASEFRVAPAEGGYRVEIVEGGRTLMKSPAEGLWTIARDWQNQWAADFVFGNPTEIEHVGEWTVLRGTIETPDGTWAISDAYRSEGDLVKCIRRFVWQGEETARKCTMVVRFVTPGSGKGLVIPGVIYHGNPSGARSGRTPMYSGTEGDLVSYEEHRLPMPFVSFEWKDGDAFRGAALHTLPSPSAHANLPDQWWSLGAYAKGTSTDLILMSGPCASNRQLSIVKGLKTGFLPYDNAYLNVPPGGIIEKTFYLEAYDVPREGSGFRKPVETALRLFPPTHWPDLPTFPEILESKYRYAKTRWYEKDGAAGFKKYHDRNVFVLGWTGQAAALGYALQALSPGLDDPQGLEMAQKSLDFLSGAAFFEGGFYTWYDYTTKKWDRDEPLSQAQAMLNFANAIRVAEQTGLDASKWKPFLKKACTFHADRIMYPGWKAYSTDEAFFIAPLCKGYKLFGEKTFLAAAEKLGDVYAKRSVNMREPYWGGTLDARCEDKEGAFAALQGFLALHEMTGDKKYLEWAQHACDVVLTYVVVWDIDMPAGRLRDHGFKTRGWTAVSVQNHHIDVFGVLIAPDIYRLGKLTGRPDLQKLALLMYRSCGQLIDPYGSQGEQPQHTNYVQLGSADTVFGHRGGYHEDWTVFWITAHFLNAAAQFQELGVSIWE